MRKAMSEASTQATPMDDAPSWSTFDIGRAMSALRTGSESTQRTILRRLHVRWWHASATKMQHILRQAGVRGPVLELCKSICNTCRICRKWTRPGDRPMAKTRISTQFNEVVQADLLFWRHSIVLHMIDECTRYSLAVIVDNKEAAELCHAMKRWWFRIFQPPTLLLIDQEGSLGSVYARDFLQKHQVDVKSKPTDLPKNLSIYELLLKQVHFYPKLD